MRRLRPKFELLEMVQQARQQAGEPPGFEATVGDARDLAEPDESADAVLLLGPLYHLPARDDRMKALAEAHRVLRPGGFLAAAAISRYTFLLPGSLEAPASMRTPRPRW